MEGIGQGIYFKIKTFVDMAPNRMALQAMKKKQMESFKEYAQR